jgi:hypothetical protein
MASILDRVESQRKLLPRDIIFLLQAYLERDHLVRWVDIYLVAVAQKLVLPVSICYPRRRISIPSTISNSNSAHWRVIAHPCVENTTSQAVFRRLCSVMPMPVAMFVEAVYSHVTCLPESHEFYDEYIATMCAVVSSILKKSEASILPCVQQCRSLASPFTSILLAALPLAMTTKVFLLCLVYMTGDVADIYDRVMKPRVQELSTDECLHAWALLRESELKVAKTRLSTYTSLCEKNSFLPLPLQQLYDTRDD